MDFSSMIGGIDDLMSQYNCFNFDNDQSACDAQANCAFHRGGCKVAVNASQAALRMVGAPEHYLEFDRLDKLDLMCQGLTADQCSLAKECEVVDGSPTTCARSGGYYIAAAALACEGAPTVSGQWGNWHETASEMLNMSLASAIELFDYPGYRGCENTCEGRDVNETACGGMDFCDWDAALGRCYSAVGPDLCPIEWASADAFCSSVEASLACPAPSSAANASTCPSVCDWIEGAASDPPCSTPSSFRSILDETSSHTQTVFAHSLGCGAFSTQGECDAARGGGSCAWRAGVDECHPAVGAAEEALSDAGAPFAVARFESLSLLAHPDLCPAHNDNETQCVAEPSCEWIEDEYGSTSCAPSEAYRLALAADACFGHSDMRRAASAVGFPGGDASKALEHLPGNATAFPSAASFCPAWSLWMTCGTDRASCESDPECPADQCAPAWGAFEALFAAREAVTSDAIAACGTLARSRDAHSCEATVSPASSSRVSASDVSCAWDASALACEPSGAAAYRAVVDSGLAPRAVAEFVRLDVDGVGPCSGLSAVECDASRACGWDETSRGACGWSFEYYVAAAANACADHDSSPSSLFDALAEAVGVHNVSRARDVAGVERRLPYPGYVGCQLECEGAFVSREACESKSRAHCTWSATEGRCESVVGDAPCPEDQPARGWINVTHAVGDRWFDETFWESHHGIIRVDRLNREWAYYRRVDPRDRAFEPYHHVFNNWFQRGNRIDVDFEMYSTYDAALKRDPARRWTHCGGGQESERPGYGFPGECFPSVEAYWEHQDAVAAGTPPPPERRVRVATDSPSYESKGCRLRTAKGEACVTGGVDGSGESFVESAFPGAFTVYLETPAPPELTRGGAFAPPQDANRATFLAGERELTGAGDLGLGGAERFTARFKARLADEHRNATPGVLVITPAESPAGLANSASDVPSGVRVAGAFDASGVTYRLEIPECGVDLRASRAVPSGSLADVIFTYDGDSGEAKLYVDGALDAETRFTRGCAPARGASWKTGDASRLVPGYPNSNRATCEAWARRVQCEAHTEAVLAGNQSACAESDGCRWRRGVAASEDRCEDAPFSMSGDSLNPFVFQDAVDVGVAALEHLAARCAARGAVCAAAECPCRADADCEMRYVRTSGGVQMRTCAPSASATTEALRRDGAPEALVARFEDAAACREAADETACDDAGANYRGSRFFEASACAWNKKTGECEPSEHWRLANVAFACADETADAATAARPFEAPWNVTLDDALIRRRHAERCSGSTCTCDGTAYIGRNVAYEHYTDAASGFSPSPTLSFAELLEETTWFHTCYESGLWGECLNGEITTGEPAYLTIENVTGSFSCDSPETSLDGLYPQEKIDNLLGVGSDRPAPIQCFCVPPPVDPAPAPAGGCCATFYGDDTPDVCDSCAEAGFRCRPSVQPHDSSGFVANASAPPSYDCVSFAYADLDACAAALTPPLTASDVTWLDASTCAPAPIRADAVQKAGAAGLTGEVHFLTTWPGAALTSADVRRAFVADYGDASSSARVPAPAFHLNFDEGRGGVVKNFEGATVPSYRAHFGPVPAYRRSPRTRSLEAFIGFPTRGYVDVPGSAALDETLAGAGGFTAQVWCKFADFSEPRTLFSNAPFEYQLGGDWPDDRNGFFSVHTPAIEDDGGSVDAGAPGSLALWYLTHDRRVGNPVGDLMTQTSARAQDAHGTQVTLALNRWTHVSLTRDREAGVARLSVDGVVVAEVQVPPSAPHRAGAGLRIGGLGTAEWIMPPGMSASDRAGLSDAAGAAPTSWFSDFKLFSAALAPAFPGGASVCGGALESAANLVAWLPLAGGDGAGENATFADASGHGHDGFPVGAFETASVDFAAHPVVRDVTPAGASMYSKPAVNGTAACAPWGAYDGCAEGDWGCTECLSGAGFDLGECGNKARGGAVSFADGFTIHTFKENGVFEVLRRDLDAVEVLVVGGGGGGRVGAEIHVAWGGFPGEIQHSGAAVVGEAGGFHIPPDVARFEIVVGRGGAGARVEYDADGAVAHFSDAEDGGNSAMSTLHTDGTTGVQFEAMGGTPVDNDDFGGWNAWPAKTYPLSETGAPARFGGRGVACNGVTFGCSSPDSRGAANDPERDGGGGRRPGRGGDGAYQLEPNADARAGDGADGVVIIRYQ